MATERGRDGDQKSFGHLGRWPVLADEQVQSNTPTQADGFTAAKEFTLRKKAARVVFDTAKAQGVTAGTSTVAVTMFLRFFCRRSMEKNHPFVVALASLFLACKVNDNPRSLRGLQVEMLKQWYGRDSPELRERLNEKRTMDRLRETAIRAEALLLMTLGFDLNIDVLLTSFVNLMNEVPELRGFKNPKLQQKLVNVCNDIMQNDGALVLVHTYKKLAVAICHFFCDRWTKDESLTVPPNNPDGSRWFERFGLAVDEMAIISDRLAKMYKKMNKEKSKEKSKTVTTNSSGAFAASVRPTGSRVGSGVSGSPAATNAHVPLKRQRSEPEIGTEVALQEAFRSQTRDSMQHGNEFSARKERSDGLDHRGAQATLPAVAAGPPSPPEEGEIEEGEIA